MGLKNIYLIATIALLLLSVGGGFYLIKAKQDTNTELIIIPSPFPTDIITDIPTPTDLPIPTQEIIITPVASVTIATTSTTITPTKKITPISTIDEPSPTRISIPEAGVDFPFKGLALIGLITTLFGILVLL